MADRRAQVSSGSPFEASIGFSRGVRAGQHIAISGTAPIWPDGAVDPDPLAQARRCWQIAIDALIALGGAATDVVRTRTFLTRREDEPAASAAHGEVFADVRPASTMLIVSGLLDPRWRVEVELDAIIAEAADPSATPTRPEGQA